MWNSAVLIGLPELAGWTDRWRSVSYHEVSGRPLTEHVPPHVTVLVPWADPDDVAARDRLVAVAHDFAPVELGFDSAGAFANGTVFLEPSPDLTGLLRAVAGAFPEFRPYGGEHPDPHPHVTVSARGGAEVLAEVEAALASGPPPRALVDRLAVYVPEADGVWRERYHLPLS